MKPVTKNTPQRVLDFLNNPKSFKLIKTIDDDDKPIFVSFSAGETSGDMLLRLWAKYSGKRKIIVLFANTGQEDEKTLQFAHNIETYYKIPIIWVEAVINPVYGKGVTHRVVDFYTAKRHTDPDTPMEELIKKLGIPNKDQLHCTRDLKTRPMEHYLKTHGFEDFHTVVGIRADELNRVTSDQLFYEPFASGVTKPMVNARWEQRPFRLGLKGYQGNCRWCHKKTLRKHLTLINEDPEIYDFPERMELNYENYVHPERLKKIQLKGKGVHFPIRFFRENRSVSDLKKMAVGFTDFAEDDSVIYEYDEELDSPNGGCVDSCEPFR